MSDRDEAITGAALRTPRAAGVAGIVFAVLLGLALGLLTAGTPSHPADAGAWLADPHRRGAIAFALNLVSFAGIAFLWFIGVVRDRIGQREDRFFATAFLGSGLLFVAMLFVAAAQASGLIAIVDSAGPASRATGHQITSILLRVYALRMAGVFIITTSTIVLRTRVVHRWIAYVGYGVAVVMLVSFGLTPWLELLFPAWILVLSIDILRAGPTTVPAQGSD